MANSVLVIDDDVDMCALLDRFLSKNGYVVETAHSSSKGIEKFKAGNFDVVISDFRLGEKKDGKDVLLEIKEHNPRAVVLIITGYSDIKIAVDVIKSGAYDYITKPLVPDEVLSVLSAALRTTASYPLPVADDAATNKSFKKNKVFNAEFLTGQSMATKELYNQIAIVAPTNYSVILNG